MALLVESFCAKKVCIPIKKRSEIWFSFDNLFLLDDVHPPTGPDPEIRKKRKKAGGNSKKSFTEGWVEFQDKKVAKLVALSLNNTPIGGKKRNYYRFVHQGRPISMLVWLGDDFSTCFFCLFS